MAFLTSMFRNLKNGGSVKFEKASPFHQMLIDNPGGLVRRKEGGQVKPTFMEALHRMNNMPRVPIRKKKGGKVRNKARKLKTKNKK